MAEHSDPRNLKTPYRVTCRTHGPVCLTTEEYSAQMHAPDSFWACPIDGSRASWDDDWFEAQIETMGDDLVIDVEKGSEIYVDTDPKKIGETRGKDNALITIKAGYYPTHTFRRSVIAEYEDGDYQALSVNTGYDHFLEPHEFIVNHDCSEEFLHLMQMTGLFEVTGKTASYGFVRDQPIWRIRE